MTAHPKTYRGAVLTRELLDELLAGEDLEVRDDERASRPRRFVRLNVERSTAFISDGARIIARISMMHAETNARLARYSVN